MNTKLTIVLFLALFAVAFSESTKCHESCICEQTETLCAECNICTRCIQEEGTQVVAGDFCQCLTPEWRQTRGPNGEWACEKVTISVPPPTCEWQLFNQIINIVVHSNCSLQQDEEGHNYVNDVVSYDWRRVAVQIDEECKQQLKAELVWAKDCTNYAPLDKQFWTVDAANNQTVLRIALIDVYQLTSVLKLSDDGRTIYQNICLGIKLSNARVLVRTHYFQVRVYTNRDQVQIFHLDVSPQVTEGCDKGQECIVVANLDTKGDICTDASCNNFLAPGVVPVHVINDMFYVRIQFKDNSYTNFLHVVSVKFIDNGGIWVYERNTQWWTLRQGYGSVDVSVLLFQPQQNAVIEVNMKIALTRDDGTTLRNLSSTVGESTTQKFKVNVVAPTQNAEAENQANFSMNVFFGFALAAFALLI